MSGPSFRHGVASGDPLADRVVLWTRVDSPTGAPVEVTWRLATDAALADVVAGGTAVAHTGGDHSVHVDATGLRPATTYWFGFATAEAVSPVGRTRTLGTGAAPVSFAVTSIAELDAGFFNAFDRVADRSDLDFVLQLVSGPSPGPARPSAPDIGRRLEPPHRCRTLEDHRRRQRQHHRDASVQRIRAAHPLVCAPGGAGSTMADRARAEWLPLRPPGPPAGSRRLALGTVADLVLGPGSAAITVPGGESGDAGAELLVPPVAARRPPCPTGGDEAGYLLLQVDRCRIEASRWQVADVVVPTPLEAAAHVVGIDLRAPRAGAAVVLRRW